MMTTTDDALLAAALARVLDRGCHGGDTHGRRSAPKILCRSCGVRPVKANGRCHTCRQYFWKNGHDRSPAMIEAQIRRDEATLLLDWLRTATL